ncbi:MAG: YdcH family protein [Pseudomonadota bacterium]
MSVQGRIEELSHRHRKLDETIQAEQKRPAADPVTIKDLKRQKLRIKEELQHLRQP